jgi:hypothetical protein
METIAIIFVNLLTLAGGFALGYAVSEIVAYNREVEKISKAIDREKLKAEILSDLIKMTRKAIEELQDKKV